jgi:cytochrome c oxidase cbb3-type subunit I
VVFFGTLATRKVKHIYVANWFFAAFIITIACCTSSTTWRSRFWMTKSYVIYAGVRRDGAVVVRPQRGGLLPDRRLPRHDVLLHAQAAERPIYSYRLSIVHFWALIFLYIWAGPHHLHYTRCRTGRRRSAWCSRSCCWMPSWGGMINGIMTLSGAWDKLRTDPMLRS